VNISLVVATLQNFIHKHTIDLENVQRNKKKEKGEFIRHQNYMSKSFHVKN
jgi:hypothetical protein